ncbi:MAG: hypothetical protein ABII27_07300 [bacterium]
MEVKITITDKNITADIKNNAVYWSKVVIGEEIAKVGKGSDKLHLRIQSYINAHLSIWLDNQQLKGNLKRYSFEENPWVSSEKAEVHFFLTYDLPKKKSKLIKIKSVFFINYYEPKISNNSDKGDNAKSNEHIEQADHDHSSHDYLISHEFLTKLVIKSGKCIKKDLPIEDPEVVLTFADYQQTFFQSIAEYFIKGILILIIFVPFSFLLLGWMLMSYNKNLIIKEGIFVYSGVVTGILIMNCISSLQLPGYVLNMIGWAVVVLFCVYNYFLLSRKMIKLFLLAAGFVMGMISLSTIFNSFAIHSLDLIRLLAFCAGILISIAIFCILTNNIVRIYKIKLSRYSESKAEEIFIGRMKFATFTIIIVAGLFIAQIVKSNLVN